MRQLTEQAWQQVQDLARRYGASTDAVQTLLLALVNGGGTMAQFNIPELGGGGQWMQGGMTMVGDMFNYALKGKVDGLCSELSMLLLNDPFVEVPPVSGQGSYAGGQQYTGASQQQYQGSGQQQNQGSGRGGFGGGGNWWPAGLGSPNASGGQNNIRYAYFGGTRRLAVEENGQVTVYDTGEHQIGGVSQQQGGGSSLTFTSQYGTVRLADLPVVSGGGGGPSQTVPPVQSPRAAGGPTSPAQQGADEADIFAKIERLADLKKKGIVSEEEFLTKKAELLRRL